MNNVEMAPTHMMLKELCRSIPYREKVLRWCWVEIEILWD